MFMYPIEKKIFPIKYVGYLGYGKGSVYHKRWDLLMQASASSQSLVGFC